MKIVLLTSFYLASVLLGAMYAFEYGIEAPVEKRVDWYMTKWNSPGLIWQQATIDLSETERLLHVPPNQARVLTKFEYINCDKDKQP